MDGWINIDLYIAKYKYKNKYEYNSRSQIIHVHSQSYHASTEADFYRNQQIQICQSGFPQVKEGAKKYIYVVHGTRQESIL